MLPTWHVLRCDTFTLTNHAVLCPARIQAAATPPLAAAALTLLAAAPLAQPASSAPGSVSADRRKLPRACCAASFCLCSRGA